MSGRDDSPRPLQGDEAQFFEAHAARLRRSVGGAINTSPDHLDDACAFAWMQFIRRQPERETAFGWLWKVAWREALRLHRGAQRVEPREAIGDEMVSPVNPLAATETMIDARGRLSHLASRDRTAMFLRGAGFTYEEAAERLGVSPTRVRHLLVRASEQLHEQEQLRQGEDRDLSPRARLLAELLRQPPPFLHASIGRPPTMRTVRSGTERRLEWSRLALAIVDYRLERGISDPARAFGSEPLRAADDERKTLQQRIDGFDIVRDRGRPRTIDR